MSIYFSAVDVGWFYSPASMTLKSVLALCFAWIVFELGRPSNGGQR